MSEPNVNEIVARIEEDIFTVTQDDIRAIITSWRERGEALRLIRRYAEDHDDDMIPMWIDALRDRL